MSTRLLLQGTEIESLLARVHDEHGPQARIVKAERVRAGGVGGFFAREHYEVTVEVEEPAGIGAAVPPAAAGDAVAAASGTLPRPRTSSPAAGGRLDILEAAPESVEELLAGVGATAPDVQAWSPPRVDRSAVHERTRPAAARVKDSPAPTDADEPAHRPVSTEGAAFADVLQTLTDHARREEPAEDVPAEDVPTRPLPVDAVPVEAPSAPTVPTALVPAAGDRLARLGLPARLLARATAGDVIDQLRQVVAQLPAAPPLRMPHGGVVAVLGPQRHALAAAAAVAGRMHLPDTAVLVAGAASGVPARRRLAGTSEARRRAALSRARETTVVVVLPVEVDDDPQWAHDLLDALAPEQIWATVDATRKTADTRRHLRHLTGATGVDCIAVHGAGATSDPATVLDLGVPVALLDGATVTPRTWTALLLERLVSGEV